MTTAPSAGAKAAIGVAVAGGLFTVGLMIAVSEPRALGAGGLAVLAAFGLFAVAPYAALAMVARRLTGRAEGWAALITALLIALPAGAIYVLGFFVQPDAQSGLLFLFVPIYQGLAGLAAVLISAIVLRLVRARDRG